MFLFLSLGVAPKKSLFYSEELPLRPATIFSIEFSVPANASLACPAPPRLVGVARDWKMLAVGVVEALDTPNAAAIAAAWTCRASWAFKSILGWNPPSWSWLKGLGAVGLPIGACPNGLGVVGMGGPKVERHEGLRRLWWLLKSVPALRAILNAEVTSMSSSLCAKKQKIRKIWI